MIWRKEKALDLLALSGGSVKYMGRGKYKQSPLPPEGLQKGDRGKQIGRGTMLFSFLPWGPETLTCAMASEISRYIWKN